MNIEYSVALLIAVVILGIIVLFVLLRTAWQVAEPNQALIISGMGPKGQNLGFRTVTGGGTIVLPGLQTVRRLGLNMREAKLTTSCVTSQGIPVLVNGVCIYKIGDDPASIANAARRFLDQPDEVIDRNIQSVLDGHLRSIVGTLTIEQLIRDRDALTGQVREAVGVEMQKLGLVIDSLQIQDFGDPSKYIENLAKPHIADVQRQARIAQATADQEATQAEQAAEAIKAQARRDSEVKQANMQAEIKAANAQAAQAEPLASAQAQQKVIIEQTKLQELEAQRKEQQLQVEVRKPADAQAYAIKVTAEAQRDASISAAEAEARRTTLEASAKAAAAKTVGEGEAAAILARGTAEGAATKARLLAEADGIKARAEALATNQDAVVRQTIAESLPAIISGAAQAYGGVKSVTILDGGEGVSRNVGSVIATGLTFLPRIMEAITASASSKKGSE